MLVSGEDCPLNQSFHLENNHIRSICRDFFPEIKRGFSRNPPLKFLSFSSETPWRWDIPSTSMRICHLSIATSTRLAIRRVHDSWQIRNGEFCLVKWWVFMFKDPTTVYGCIWSMVQLYESTCLSCFFGELKELSWFWKITSTEKANKNLNECYLSNGDKQKDLFETWWALTSAKFHEHIPWKSTDSPTSESTWTCHAPPPPRLDAVATRLASTVTPLLGKQAIEKGVPNHFLSHWKPTPIWNAGVDLFHWIPIPSKPFSWRP